MKSGSQKALKVISVLLIIYAVLVIVLGVFMSFGGTLAELGEMTMDVEGNLFSVGLLSMVFGVMFIIFGVVDLVIGVLGVRGANNPNKIGAFYVLSIAGVIMSAIGIGMSIAQGGIDLYSVVNFFIVLVCMLLAANIRRQARR